MNQPTDQELADALNEVEEKEPYNFYRLCRAMTSKCNPIEPVRSLYAHFMKEVYLDQGIEIPDDLETIIVHFDQYLKKYATVDLEIEGIAERAYLQSLIVELQLEWVVEKIVELSAEDNREFAEEFVVDKALFFKWEELRHDPDALGTFYEIWMLENYGEVGA